MKILVINLHSTRNAGDAVLFRTCADTLAAAFPEGRLVLAANDGESFRTRYPDLEVVDSFFAWTHHPRQRRGGQRWLLWLLTVWSLLLALLTALLYRLGGRYLPLPLLAVHAQTLRAYADADMVVSCPGNLLYSRSYKGGVTFLFPLFTIAYAQLLGKPLYIMPQTIGPLERAWERRLVALLLKRVRIIMVREPASLELLAAIGVERSRCHLIPDLAFLFRGADVGEGRRLLTDHLGIARTDLDGPLVGVTVLNWGAQQPGFHRQAAYEQAVAQAIGGFLRKYNGRAILFPQVCGPTAADDDRTPSRRVQALLADPHSAGRVSLIAEEWAPESLHAAYGQTDLFVGSRLHSNIFALTHHVPVVAIAYQMKTVGVMRALGLEPYVINIEAVTGDNLSAAMEAAWRERAVLRRAIAARVEALQAEALHAGQLIAADFAAR
jgi:colanic acid/amylovoran biosynthesis protein